MYSAFNNEPCHKAASGKDINSFLLVGGFMLLFPYFSKIKYI